MKRQAVTVLDWIVDRLYDFDAVIYRAADRLNRLAADIERADR